MDWCTSDAERATTRQAIRVIRLYDDLPIPADVRQRVAALDADFQREEQRMHAPLAVRLLTRALIRQSLGDWDRMAEIVAGMGSRAIASAA
jgi:hypothetical protein